MKKIIGLLVILNFFILLSGSTGPHFDEFFVNKTMRIDYFQTGTNNQTIISLDEISEEPVWSGSLANLVDTSNFGKHLVEVFDAETGRLLYSRGFGSIFSEWQTTDEAAGGIFRTFSASVRIPFPKKTIKLTLSSHDHFNQYQEEFSLLIDPNNSAIKQFVPAKKYHPKTYLKNGQPQQKVDILILPDGYTKKEMKIFRRDVDHFMTVLFSEKPFEQLKDKFNVYYIEVPSEQSGIDNPNKRIYTDTLFSLTYNSLNVDRYVLTLENKNIRKIAANSPYDFICFLFNSPKYGGGGIYNLYSTCYNHSDSLGEDWWPDYVFVHEFGHLFAGLGDEYYSSSVSYNEFYPLDVEPWEPNLTILKDPTHLKWRQLVEKDIPLPTPWDKENYDKIPASQADDQMRLLRNQKYWGKVGCFEGAGYSSKGLYRPSLDCRMFSKSLYGFCPVCQQAIITIVRFLSD